MRITKKARIEACRELIDRNHIDIPFPRECLDEFKRLTGFDFIEGAIRRKNLEYPSDPRHVHILVSGVELDKSWKKQITGRDLVSDQKKAMRKSVASDMAEFMSGYEGGCEFCGSFFYLSVDHDAPPFDDIANAFLEENPDIVIARRGCGGGKLIADPSIEAMWVAFHAARATYQILCRSCNSSKGKRVLP